MSRLIISGRDMTVSWRGNTSLDWNEMKQLLYANRSSYTYWLISHASGEWIEESTDKFKEVSMMPFMKCDRMDNVSKVFGIASKEEGIEVLIADPTVQPAYRRIRTGVSGDLLTLANIKKKVHLKKILCIIFRLQ